MDILIGLLIILAMVYVFTRPFRQRSSGEENIYNRLAGLDGDENGLRMQCPHCGESILSTARVCLYCGRDIDPSEG